MIFSQALAELEGGGMAKVLFNKDTGVVLGVHIIGIHASDLIQECSNAMSAGTTVRELSMMVHTHPTREYLYPYLYPNSHLHLFLPVSVSVFKSMPVFVSVLISVPVLYVFLCSGLYRKQEDLQNVLLRCDRCDVCSRD